MSASDAYEYLRREAERVKPLLELLPILEKFSSFEAAQTEAKNNLASLNKSIAAAKDEHAKHSASLADLRKAMAEAESQHKLQLSQHSAEKDAVTAAAQRDADKTRRTAEADAREILAVANQEADKALADARSKVADLTKQATQLERSVSDLTRQVSSKQAALADIERTRRQALERI